MDFYRKHWYDIGGVLAIVIGGNLALFGKHLSHPQLFSALNLIALLVHQFEEYRFPGYFPGQFNAGVLKSETPDRYPLNTQVAMMINTVLAYPMYVLPVLFPKKVWIGLTPVLMGFGQVLIHGMVFPLRAKARYGPGFVTALCLHLPIGIAYIRQITREQPVKGTDWMKGILSFLGFALGGIVAPILLLRDKKSPYRFAEQQVGPYAHR